MVQSVLRRALRPVRRLIDTLVPVEPRPPQYSGPHGCLRAGASFIAWNQVDGDYLEFGVSSGDSFIAAWHAITAQRQEIAAIGLSSPEYQAWADRPPRMIAFDSFAGLPGGASERHPDYTPGAYTCSEPAFRANVARAGVPAAAVVTVPGFYETTLNAATKQLFGLSRAAMVMIDCDLYESTVPVLNFITDLIGQGSIIIFHDWFRFKGSPRHGEQRACAEWLARNPHIELVEFWREGPQAVSFLVNLR